MKIIKFSESVKQERPDGRTVRKLFQQDLGMSVSNMQMLYVTHPPNFREDLHSHNKSYEILLFLDDAVWRINGSDFEIKKDDVIIFEPGDVHGGMPVNNEVRLWIFQNPAITDDKVVVKRSE